MWFKTDIKLGLCSGHKDQVCVIWACANISTYAIDLFRCVDMHVLGVESHLAFYLINDI